MFLNVFTFLTSTSVPKDIQFTVMNGRKTANPHIREQEPSNVNKVMLIINLLREWWFKQQEIVRIHHTNA